ncbi:MAG: glucosaminidase domain-containing protein [Chloroflexales bacterium]|nr:glucosaminidase domain-containing protein [Chloroflexales bacterium]
MFTEESGLYGPTLASEANVVRAILARPHGEYTEQDIAGVMVPAYFHICATVGLNPVLVIAQAIVETDNFASWWAARPRRNPAGIGVNGRTTRTQPNPAKGWEFDQGAGLWKAGRRFASWKDDAIPAHIGRLLAYLVTPAAASTLLRDRLLIDQALAYHPIDSRVRGSVRCLRHLGQAHNPSGLGWAKPGIHYGTHIAAVARRLIAD